MRKVRRRRKRYKNVESRLPDFSSDKIGYLDIGLFAFAIASITGIVNLFVYADAPVTFKVERAEPVSLDALIVWINQQDVVSINGEYSAPESWARDIWNLTNEQIAGDVYIMAHPDSSFGKVTQVRERIAKRIRCEGDHPCPPDPSSYNEFYVTP